MDYRNDTILRRKAAALVLITVILCPWTAYAASSDERQRDMFSNDATAAEEVFLPVDEAFRFSATVTAADRVELFWQIAEGYYLYHDKFSFRVLEGGARIDDSGVEIPPGGIREDESFGLVEVNTGEITVELPLHREGKQDPIPLVLQVVYQGCKEDEICYPPVERDVVLTLSSSNRE